MLKIIIICGLIFTNLLYCNKSYIGKNLSKNSAIYVGIENNYKDMFMSYKFTNNSTNNKALYRHNLGS